MRHTAQPLTAGDWHGFPLLFERALQRKAWCMASFEEEGALLPSIQDLYGCLAAPHHGIRDKARSAFTVTAEAMSEAGCRHSAWG